MVDLSVTGSITKVKRAILKALHLIDVKGYLGITAI